METITKLMVSLAKGILLLLGGLLLFGGGMCALTGVANLGQGAGMITMVLIAVIVAAIGWGLLQAASKLGSSEERKTVIDAGKSSIVKLLFIAVTVWLVIQLGLTALQVFLR